MWVVTDAGKQRDLGMNPISELNCHLLLDVGIPAFAQSLNAPSPPHVSVEHALNANGRDRWNGSLTPLRFTSLNQLRESIRQFVFLHADAFGGR